MSDVLSAKPKSFISMDDEEDALLNEAICCSRNMELKTDDEEEERVQAKIAQPSGKNKMWCDMTSDSSSNMSDLSLSNGKIDLSTSGENVNASLLNGKDSDRSTVEDNTRSSDAETLKIKNESKDALEIHIESKDVEALTSEPVEDADEKMVVDVPETNGRNCKRVREGEDNDDNSKFPKNRRNSEASSSSSTLSSLELPRKKPVEYETDPVLLARRQKDIDYGKNTVGYDKYTQKIPKQERATDHPRTPPMHLKCSRRAWDGMVRLWRKQLHFWDPQNESEKKDKSEDKGNAFES